MDKKTEVFKFIAPYYGLFFNFQLRYYRKILSRVSPDFNISGCKTVLDIGCGTGALCQVLRERGMQVTGVDAEEKMLQIARRKLQGQNVALARADLNTGLPFADKAFDLVISSYVAHGLMPEERQRLYAEMKRLAGHYAVLHDYNQQRAWLTDVIERMEGGDYFNFTQNVHAELEAEFAAVKVVQVDRKAAWYSCRA